MTYYSGVNVVFFIAGLTLLALGAELLVRGASRLALTFGISPLVVGLTVVAFGTGAPELAVSLQSGLAGQGGIAIGNVIGSNIFNVLFVLGLSALVVPLAVSPQVIRQEIPVMVGASLLLWGLVFDGRLVRWESALLVTLLVAYTVFLVWQSRRARPPARREFEEALPRPAASAWDGHWSVQILLVVAGLVLLVFGARWLVRASVAFATYLGVSKLIIGLTIVAVGTSLPEIATSIIAAVRGERDIAVGNVIGSNIFNILGVLGMAGLVAPAGLTVAPGVLGFGMLVMLAAAIACFPVVFTGRVIARWEGGLFLFFFAAYTLYLFLYAQRHPWLGSFSVAMLGFVLPLTAITLVVTAWREWRRRR